MSSELSADTLSGIFGVLTLPNILVDVVSSDHSNNDSSSSSQAIACENF